MCDKLLGTVFRDLEGCCIDFLTKQLEEVIDAQEKLVERKQ